MTYGLPWWLSGREFTSNAGDMVRSLGLEDPLEKEMATHSSILACRILWAEEPGRLQSIVSHRVGHDCSYLHSSTLAWEIPRMEEPGGPQSIGLQRVGHD